MELFPSEYIHIGGDEAAKSAWKTCPLCQKRMKEEGLKDVDELQSYLIHRIERFLNEHGRSLLKYFREVWLQTQPSCHGEVNRVVLMPLCRDIMQ